MLKYTLLGLSFAITVPYVHAGDERNTAPKSKVPQCRIIVVSSNDLEVYRLDCFDPESSGWQTIARTGPTARLSPDGAAVALGRRGFVFTAPLKPRPAPEVIGQIGRLDLPEIYAPHVAWCPDGKSIIASGILAVEPEMRYETSRYDAKMGMGKPLPVPDTDFVLDVSPDGQWLLTSGRRGPGFRDWEVCRRRVDGTGEVQVIHKGSGVGRFSPDGTKVLCTRTELDEARAGTFVVDIDGKNPRRVHPVPAPACWSPDGTRLVLAVEDRPPDRPPAPAQGEFAPPVRMGGLEPEAIVGQLPAIGPRRGRIEVVITDLQGKRVSAHPTPTGDPVVNLDWR